MIKFLLLILLSIPTKTFAIEKEIQLTFNKENAKYWQYISDRTMGGISDGQAILDQDEDMIFARLIGNVSTKNNGGFIQLRSTLSFMKLDKEEQKIKGVRLNVRGNGETYHIFIRTSENRSYRDYYSATFTTNKKWNLVDIPFAKFNNKYSNKVLQGDDIRTFALVAYGRDFISDVSVSKIIFYY